MEYVYAAMLLHKAGQKIDDAGVKKVLTAAGVHVDDSRVKALVAALDGVDIEKAIEKAAAMPVAQAAPAHAAPAGGEKKEAAKPKEEKVSEEQAAAGLGSLFG